jgi:uncharacterized membrane protein YebE (DUF533 family)
MDINKVFSGLSQSGLLGGLAGGAVSGALMSNKKVRKSAGTLLKVGGVAALGTMAWKAYQGYQNSQAQQSPGGAAPAGSGWQNLSQRDFDLEPAATPSIQSPQVLLVKAMIAAACADGHLDAQERERVMTRVQQMSLAPDEKALIFDALQAPPTMAAICEQVHSPELAAEVYLSSLLAVERQRPEAQLYLDALAFRLDLPQGLAEQMNREVDAGLPSAAA